MSGQRGPNDSGNTAGETVKRLGMTFQEAAKAAGVTEDDIIDAIAAGELQAHVHRNRVLIRSADVDMWLTALPVWRPACQGDEATKRLRLA
jgi:excisionase family DNA binding protein